MLTIEFWVKFKFNISFNRSNDLNCSLTLNNEWISSGSEITIERDLQNEIKSKKIIDLKSVYRYTFNYGCLALHANKVLEKMKKEKKIKSSLRLKKVNIHKLEDNILLQCKRLK